MFFRCKKDYPHLIIFITTIPHCVWFTCFDNDGLKWREASPGRPNAGPPLRSVREGLVSTKGGKQRKPIRVPTCQGCLRLLPTSSETRTNVRFASRVKLGCLLNNRYILVGQPASTALLFSAVLPVYQFYHRAQLWCNTLRPETIPSESVHVARVGLCLDVKSGERTK